MKKKKFEAPIAELVRVEAYDVMGASTDPFDGEWVTIGNQELGIRNQELGMDMKKDNVIVDKSFDFAVRIVKLYQHLNSEKKE